MINKNMDKILEQITSKAGISKDDLRRELNEIIIIEQNNPDLEIQEPCQTTEQEDEEIESKYEGMTLTDFIQKYPDRKISEIFVLDMNQRGYLYPAEGDMFIRDIQISTRLRNALARNGILLVSQLGNYQKETYLKMRNIGEESFKELEGICKKYGVEIPTLELLEKDLLPVSFTSCQLLRLYEDNIHQAKDIENLVWTS